MQTIHGRYQIETELGAGGMGTVFLGMDRQTEAKVAIKQLKAELAQPDMLERFQREGQALRELNHPNIVKLLDALEDAGQHYLIMEYVAGGDLRQLLEKGKLPYQRCLSLAIDLADALTRAHRLNIIHRDLKPANVLLAPDGTLRLTDFGVAHLVDKERVTETNAIVGTLDYLPPEVLNGDPVTTQADIWAFGVMLFEMLAGRRPFSGTGYLQTLQAIATAPIPDLEALAPDVPIALVDLVYRMLCRDPQARISSVRYVGAELEDILQGRPQNSRFETPIPDFRQRPKHNLPAQTSPFVGRENELSEIARMLQNPSLRLLTIVAQGGMGKTRLSLEAAERAIPNFEHGVYFVELAPLGDTPALLPAIANALSYQFQNDGRELKQQIADFLQAKQLLLVLDNFEHLLDGAALVHDLLQAAPQLKILVTSRQRLDQVGESLFHLTGMDFPKWETPQDALEYAAVKLFMNSALRAKPDFELTNENLDAVARICKLVQGMPLGIVLAAAWLGMLSPSEIAQELQKSLDFLESDSQQIPERQRSIRAVMEYSWQQMSASEQAVFAKLSVFRGGFTREAAEAVAGANLRILMSLVNKSLLHRDSSTGRYEIHELLRQYAEEKSKQDEAHHAHLSYFASLLDEYTVYLKGPRQIDALASINTDFENILLAWQWAYQAKDFDALYQMVEPLALFALIRSRQNELKSIFQMLISDLDTKILNEQEEVFFSWIAAWLSECFWMFMELQEIEVLTRKGLKIAQKHGNHPAIAISNLALSTSLVLQGNLDEAMSVINASIAAYRQLNDKSLLSTALHRAAFCATFQGNSSQRQQLMLEALQMAREAGNKYRIASDLHNLNFTSDPKQNRLNTEEILGIQRELGNIRGIGWSLIGAYFPEILALQFEAAQSLLAESAAIAKEYNEPALLAQTLSGDALWQFAHQDYQAALTLSQMALKNAQRSGHQGLIDTRTLDMGLYLAFTKQTSASIAYIKQAYHIPYLVDMAELDSVLYAALPLVLILHQREEKIACVELLARVFSDNRMPALYIEDPYFKQIQADLKLELGLDNYTAAYERGKSLDLETVIQELLNERQN